eukprot:CAMPEP_0119553432 /NCGR_PEP_ID=MMETSP1352-20130426/6188_1 /TAXON_ID=265584 /ORGANISM="Stauroneis constricta, Strain CCMP1120" /LENGTH=333 /DNA_ID=CAMNT_0007599847 /DNA_START=380 /DNA_END=1378 /DNA_ORIENTATION=-
MTKCLNIETTNAARKGNDHPTPSTAPLPNGDFFVYMMMALGVTTSLAYTMHVGSFLAGFGLSRYPTVQMLKLEKKFNEGTMAKTILYAHFFMAAMFATVAIIQIASTYKMLLLKKMQQRNGEHHRFKHDDANTDSSNSNSKGDIEEIKPPHEDKTHVLPSSTPADSWAHRMHRWTGRFVVTVWLITAVSGVIYMLKTKKWDEDIDTGEKTPLKKLFFQVNLSAFGLCSAVNLVVGVWAVVSSKKFNTDHDGLVKKQQRMLLHKTCMAFALLWTFHSALNEVTISAVQLAFYNCLLGNLAGATITFTLNMLQLSLIVVGMWRFDKALLRLLPVW